MPTSCTFWQQWWNAPSFSVPCERKCVDSGGKTVIRAWSDDLKELYTASAQKDWLAEINRPHARRGEGVTSFVHMLCLKANEVLSRTYFSSMARQKDD